MSHPSDEPATIYIGGSRDGKTARAIAVKTEWKAAGRDYVDATMFRDVNKTYFAGLKDAGGTFSGLLSLDDPDAELRDRLASKYAPEVAAAIMVGIAQLRGEIPLDD